jgi:hypothetical protein
VACLAMDMEVGTVALACVYFEKLCLKGLVTKSNRYTPPKRTVDESTAHQTTQDTA